MKNRTVTITDNASGKSIECPVHEGRYGAPVIEIGNLYKELGMFTLDPGFGVTGSCRSAITYLDGEAGVLQQRGYPIEQLAEKSSFLEVAYLLIHGELPSDTEMQEWDRAIKMHGMTHEHLHRFYSGYRYDAHPMSVLTGVVGAVASFYHEDMDVYNAEERLTTARRIIGKMPNLVRC
jgi:citrate synthase